MLLYAGLLMIWYGSIIKNENYISSSKFDTQLGLELSKH
jgi:hypothetical protein